MDDDEWSSVLTVHMEDGTQKTIRRGTMVLVRHGQLDCFGAVVAGVRDDMVHLTFTPHGAPRIVDPHLIISTLPTGSKADILDVPLVPQYQPLVSIMPRRRSQEKGKAHVPFLPGDS